MTKLILNQTNLNLLKIFFQDPVLKIPFQPNTTVYTQSGPIINRLYIVNVCNFHTHICVASDLVSLKTETIHYTSVTF